jgi:TonB family protein
MTELFVNKYRKLHRYIRLRPNLGWSVFSFFVLLFMLFVVRWSESSDASDFSVSETIEMIELRLAEQLSVSEVKESEDEESVAEEIPEEKPLCFGEDSPEFSDLNDSVIPPRPLFSKLPQYPSSMRKAGVEGVVSIELGIDESGQVLFGKIVKSLGKEFDMAVIEWARRIKFYPAKTREKIPMKCRIILPVRFKLEG